MLKDAAAHRPASRLASDVMTVANLARKKAAEFSSFIAAFSKINKDPIYACNAL